MAYCNKCGAYIPDGQTVCLACGHDIEEEKAQAEQAQAAQAQAQAAETQTAQTEEKKPAYDDSANYYSFSNEELREKLEEQRRKQQEQSRKWAEQEKQRRERESVKDNWKTYTGTQSSAPRYKTQKNTSSGSSTRTLSVLSYISGLFLIPMFFKPEDRKAGFHAKQGLRLFLFGVVSDAMTKIIPGLGSLLQLARFFLMLKGMLNAINDREEPLPFIGNIGGKN